jgi:outer membrane protein
MKKLNLIFAVLFLFAVNISAQLKIAFVDSDTIMDQYPDAQDAQKKLDAFVAEWQDQLAKLDKEFKAKYDDYEKRKLIMSEQKRVDTERELVKMEDNIAKFRQEKFGANGELFKKQEEIMKPIQNKVFNVIQEVAKKEGYDFIFDRSGDVLFLYAKDEYDLTKVIIDKLKENQ